MLMFILIINGKGSALVFLTPFVTLTFLVFTPETWVHGADAHTEFPIFPVRGRLVLERYYDDSSRICCNGTFLQGVSLKK